jgi:ABC-type polar amino acid transport system ATPase subunit
VIEFRDVHKHFGQLHVLRGITLSVKEREVVVVIGPSGSGKSTMLRTINRLEAIESGTLSVGGIAVHDPKLDVNRVRKNVGMVFQSFNLFPHLTAAENHRRGLDR